MKGNAQTSRLSRMIVLGWDNLPEWDREDERALLRLEDDGAPPAREDEG